ncbi:Ca2+ regulator and membrane fusion protein Fig1-domain-containing protein [Xylariaceae sp. FL0016]|nr:Ca2+ regulator and membrane fusion protein Fig1-domain-containing protein [Xylariaceae sp. FL0016]
MAGRIRGVWYRLMPFLEYHHVLMMLNGGAVVLWSFLLAACTASNGISNVYLLSLSYHNPTPTSPSDSLVVNQVLRQVLLDQVSNSSNLVQDIRIGYFSLCVTLNSGITFCGSNAQELAAALRSEDNGDPLNILRLAQEIRTGVVFYVLIIIAIVLVLISIALLVTFPGWRDNVDSQVSEREIKPFPSRPISHAALGLAFAAAGLGFASAFWQHIGVAGASTTTRLLTYNLVETHIGAAAMVLGWLAAAIIAVSALGLLLMVVSIRVLAQLEESRYYEVSVRI